MSNLQVKNVPDGLYTRLRDYAAESNLTISTVVLEAVERELAKADMLKRLATRSSVELGVSVAELLIKERMVREEEMEYDVSGGRGGESREFPEEA